MAFSRITHQIDEINQSVRAYVQSKFEYFELKMLKWATEASARLTKLLVCIGLFLVFLGFLSVGFAILIGRALHDYSLGFFIIAGVQLILLIVFLIFGKRIFTPIILKKFSGRLTEFEKRRKEKQKNKARS